MDKKLNALNIFCKTIQNNDNESAALIYSCPELYYDNKDKLEIIKKQFLEEKIYKPLGQELLLNRTVRRFLADLCGIHKIEMVHKDRIKHFRCGLEFGVMYNHISTQYHHENDIFINSGDIERNKLYLALTYTYNELIDKQFYLKRVDNINELLDFNCLKIIRKYIKKNLIDGFLPINFGRSSITLNHLENDFDSDEYIDYSTDFISGDDNDYPYNYVEIGNYL